LLRQQFGESDDEQFGDSTSDRIVQVDAYYLDRHCVTNRQYRAFVADEGYHEMGLWEPEVWPTVSDFVDRSGQLGPRFWHQGMYPTGEDDYPVVGINWCEAQAYARWAGKRLPTDSEWVKAASWPVSVGSELPSQRKYPWGDVMDRRLANLWGSGTNGPVAVDEFAEGVGAAGLYQLCGNVWEWTAGTYGTWQGPESDSERLTNMRAIRGGAFDTYFDHQASCHFQSGDTPLTRKANIGFRCALSLCDVADDQRALHPDDEPTWEDLFGPGCGDERR
jgi:iron(II)-dependent oxidoreductase